MQVEIGFGWWGNQVRDEVTKAATDYFTENYPNITFNLNTQSWNNYWALMSTYAANNDLPDLIQQDYAYIEQWVEAGRSAGSDPLRGERRAGPVQSSAEHHRHR